MYRVKTTGKRVEKQIAGAPRKVRERIIEAIRKLGENPRPSGSEKLADDIYRIRVGRYRVIYRVYDEEKLVLIGRVVRRTERTYKQVQKLF